MKCKITFLLLLSWAMVSSQIITIPVFASGFTSPVEITNAGDSRLFVVEQGGAIKILNSNGTVSPTNFLALPSSVVLSGGERGLLGLAFHPQYTTNGYFYVNYTGAGDGATVIARYTVSDANMNVANPASAMVLMTIPQPFPNHNGGTIKFGPDGYLYIGMGDGGSGGDPGNRAQNINENLGKMLRIDVNSGNPYSVPSTNPFVGIAGNDEIWATGLRNPWKFSFNEAKNKLWIADVGQGQIEEINVVTASTPGINYGWRCYEGNNVFTDCSGTGITYTFPFASYDHSGGACSVTGGYSYTGSLYPNLNDKYIFADFCLNRIGVLDENTGVITYSATFAGSNNFTTFGRDINGELYVANTGGTVYRIVDSSLAVADLDHSTIVLSPNPASTEVRLTGNALAYPCEVMLYDITGKTLLKKSIRSDAEAVNTTSLRAGIYMVTLTDASGQTRKAKLAIK